MLMAGLDGTRNKIHLGDAMDKDLYDLPPEELAQIPTVCGSLRDALMRFAKIAHTSHRVTFSQMINWMHILT